MLEFGVIGVIAVVMAMLAIMRAVFFEFAPANGLTGRGRWLLAAGLGAGVLAFTFKLSVFGLFLIAPKGVVQSAFASLAPMAITRVAAVVADERLSGELFRHVWLPLPAQAPAPTDNPTTAEKVALGKQLFFDKNLSLSRQIACATCHDLTGAGGADGLPVSRGIDGKQGTRNAPTVWNAAFQQRLFWDGRAASLEEQAKGPLLNQVEMAMPTHGAVVERVKEESSYLPLFTRAFGAQQPITIDNIAKAIAAYERTLISPDSAYDRYVRGDKHALSETQLRGMVLFESVGCISCHSGPNFSDASVFGTGASYRAFPATTIQLDQRLHLLDDAGLALAPGTAGVWRIPSLRNVALTAPYFHNGSVNRLEDAVRLMAQSQLGLRTEADGPGESVVYWSENTHTISMVKGRLFSEQDVRDVTAFLQALSGDAIAGGQR